ncbi:MAG: ATP-binding protein [Flavobacteriales bacterium]|nr:ATP-binding protein [Flavobacteriales bacterium]
MAKKRLFQNRLVILHLSLLIYVVAQFIWWAISILKLNLALSEFNADIDFEAKAYMVLGEGVVFLLILSVGTFFVFRAFKKEVQLSKLQNNFLLAVTHEFKSPLASLQLNLQTLRDKTVNEEDEKRMLESSLSQTYRLNDLVNNILVSTRLDSDQVQPVLERVEVEDVLMSLIKTSLTEKNQKRIRFEAQPNIQKFPLDVELFKLTMINLIDNALKYSEGEVEVSYSLKNENLTVKVVDQGDGIPKSELKNIFNKFYRIGNESTRKKKGSGLGLYIVQQLCEIQNAIIQVTSNQTKGSTFELTISKSIE